MSAPITVPDLCCVLDCKRDAEYQVCGTVNAKGYPGSPPAEFFMGLSVCTDHQSAVDLHEIFPEDGDGWKSVCAAFAAMGKAAPDWKSLRLKLKALA